MSRVQAAAATDRLPWLPDEPRPQPVRRRGSAAILGSAAVLLVAVGGFWLGTESAQQPSSQRLKQDQPRIIARLPEVRPAQPEVHIAAQPEVRAVVPPQVRPEPTREVRIAASAAQRPATHSAEAAGPAIQKTDQSTVSPNSTAATAPATQQFALPKPWPSRVIAGAAGRLVQVGAFGSTHQAKRGWWFMVREYPAVAHLPAVVRTSRNSRGRVFYRFQIGTTSQAHSEVLCQRMQKIHLSCAVIGLPWKAKVER